MSRASGSYRLSMETAVRSTSIGTALGTVPRKSSTCCGNRPIRGQFGLQRIQLALPRQASIPQQVNDFLKSGVIGQSMDVVSAIAENAGVSVDITDLRLSGDNAFKARPGCRAHHLMSFALGKTSKSHCMGRNGVDATERRGKRQVKSQKAKVKSQKCFGFAICTLFGGYARRKCVHSSSQGGPSHF